MLGIYELGFLCLKLLSLASSRSTSRLSATFICFRSVVVDDRTEQKMSAKINNSIEQQMIQAASAGKLSIMRGAAEEG